MFHQGRGSNAASRQKSDVSDSLHRLWQRNLTTGEQSLRYPRIKLIRDGERG
jgi:hypothetical protein